MGTWDDSQFNEALKKKYEIQGQNANTAAQDVAQRPEIQARSDAAAMQRAELASQTQQNIAAANEAGSSARAAAAQQAQKDIAGLQDTGATTRAGMQTGTQLHIAGMENQLGRDRLNQQGQQFGQTLGLDTAKFNEQTFQGRLGLTKPITTYDSLGNRTSTPGINFSDPSQTNVMTDDELRKRRAALAGSY